MYQPGLPYHVFQRGYNRRACFFNTADRDSYLSLLDDRDVQAIITATHHCSPIGG